MTLQQQNTELLDRYRQKAAELGAIRERVAEVLEQSKRSGDLTPVTPLLDELNLRTKKLEEFRATLAPSDLFMAKYNVMVHNSRAVSFVIPKGVSRFEILEEAQGLWPVDEAYRHRGPLLKLFQKEAFRRVAPTSESVGIDVSEKGLENLTRQGQEVLLAHRIFRDKGYLGMASLEDVVVAFAAFWVATQSSLFRINFYESLVPQSDQIRTVGGTLRLKGFILGLYDTPDSDRSFDIVPAARFTPGALR
jgi:hypothetical protein